MYSPKLSTEQIKKIYLVAREQKIPMTKVVKTAVEEYLKKCEIRNDPEVVSKS